MLVIAIVIWQSLRPIMQLADHLDARRADDLHQLSLECTPRELHPFIASINRLLERIHTMVDQQRKFVADAAHELRTPITALSLQAENLDKVDLPEEGHRRLAILRDGARRTAHLLDQLLALARYDIGQPPELAVTALDRCAKGVVAEVLPDATSRGIDLGFEMIQSLSVKADPVMLAAVIRNIIDNALRYTPRGGRIDISIVGDGATAVLQIRDSGPGIPPGDLDRIFEPFFRGSRPAADGTGLGLSIVKRIVDRLNGSVAVENIADECRSGLQVVISLPIASE
jgi:two-component system OmpR family sensor kinase